MELRFKVSAHVSRPVHEVFEAVADPARLSGYFTTGGAKGRLETGATVTWDFHDFPGAFPVEVIAVEPDRRIELEWDSNQSDLPKGAKTRVTIEFTPLDGDTRTLVTISEHGWTQTQPGLDAAFGNCMGWSQMLAALKVWIEHGINLREGMYK